MTLVHGIDPKTKQWSLSDEQTKDWGWFTWLNVILSILDTRPRVTIDRVKEIFDKMKTCSSDKVYKLDVTDHEMRLAFEWIIDNKMDIEAGFELAFRDDYSGIKKTDWPVKTTIKPEQK